jgi:hypothetical protein
MSFSILIFFLQSAVLVVYCSTSENQRSTLIFENYLQVEFHPLLQQNSLRAYCESKGILMCAYSPLGSPGSFYGSGDVLSHPIINEVAQKMGKTPAQVCTCYMEKSHVSQQPRCQFLLLRGEPQIHTNAAPFRLPHLQNKYLHMDCSRTHVFRTSFAYWRVKSSSVVQEFTI